MFRPVILAALPPYDLQREAFVIDKTYYTPARAVPPDKVSSYIDGYKQADDYHDSVVQPFDVIVFSGNACTLKGNRIHKTWMSQIGNRKIALAMCQETLVKWSGKKQIGDYIVCASAADAKGSYGCRVMINTEIPFAKKCKGSNFFIK